ncbi:hypothetical protein HPB50_007116 [Hyalomma asiaticum]|uniref:Uncharacterized protein n=1 Tax=Hyalomma asiaticum TaxID=266040 RepID=A0ACB7RNN1_HYAAI|nr:hypothetical protein HPB50_007116 [Hyalomma asiaticum]
MSAKKTSAGACTTTSKLIQATLLLLWILWVMFGYRSNIARLVDRIGSLGEERRDGEIEGITARRLRLAAPPVTAASAALRLGTRRKPEHPIAIYDGDDARLVYGRPRKDIFSSLLYHPSRLMGEPPAAVTEIDLEIE